MSALLTAIAKRPLGWSCATLLIFLSGVNAGASTTLQITNFVAAGSGIASNFANASGTPTTSMQWGIIIDTDGNGFSNGSYLPFTLSGGVTTDGFLSTAAGVTKDYYFHSSTLTTDTTNNTEPGTTTHGAPGTITTISNVPFGLITDGNSHTGTIATGERFELIWFSTNSSNVGDKYGVFEATTPQGISTAFTIPSDSSTTNYSGQFTGTDLIRPATITIVPEPSTTILVLSGMWLVGRRRSRR